MTYEEAFKFCLDNRLTIHFVPIKSKDGLNTAHINTPRWFMENCNLTFPELVMALKNKLEAEAAAEASLRKEKGVPPTYDEILKRSSQ